MEATSNDSGAPLTEEMDCPQAKVGTVIGARGIIVQEIMRRSGCKIVVNQDGFPDGAPRKVVLTGHAAQILIAKQLVSAVIAEGPSAIQTVGVGDGSDGAALQISEMDCPPDKVGIVIGSRGVIIQDIMRKSGCKIVVNQHVPAGSPCVVQITGKAFQITEAKRLVTAVIENGPLALNGLDATNASGADLDVGTEEMECPADKVGIVIGAKGVIVNEIMRRSGTKVVINQEVPAGEPNVVVITGPKYRIATAKNLIASVITGGPNALQMSPMGGGGGRPTVHEFPIVQAQVGKLIGPGGSTIKEIQQNCGVRINVEVIPDSDQRIVRVSGDPERVLNAVQVVWQLLQQTNMRPQGGQQGGQRAWGGDSRGVPPHMQGWGGQQQGAPGGWNRGNNTGAGGYQGAAPAPAQGVAAPAGVQYLGADGKAGQLMPTAVMGGGYHHQVALIHHTFFDILCGGATAPNIYLIRQKSGARVSIDEAMDRDRVHVKLDIMGYYANVSLAAQMIQEVIILYFLFIIIL
jgi:rRNA processing protein Krr1/Pno1